MSLSSPPAPPASRARDAIVLFVCAVGVAAAGACGGAVPSEATSGASADASSDAALDDGGAPASGPGNDDASSPSVCTSGTTWTGGQRGSSSMLPGTDCTACHLSKEGPNYMFAGTVYPSLHEPDNCFGSPNPAGGLAVVITGANGVVARAPVNAAGNFSIARATVTPPFTVAVTDGTRRRPMVGAITNGQCNSCHTEQGNSGAAGRVMAP